MSDISDSWYIQVGDGDVHRLTLDQLDEAFQRGHIGASTLVLAPAGAGWTRLGRLASIDEPSDATHSQRPVSMDLTELEVAPARSRRRWLTALLAVAVLGAVGTIGVRRPAWAEPGRARIAASWRAAVAGSGSSFRAVAGWSSSRWAALSGHRSVTAGAPLPQADSKSATAWTPAPVVPTPAAPATNPATAAVLTIPTSTVAAPAPIATSPAVVAPSSDGRDAHQPGSAVDRAHRGKGKAHHAFPASPPAQPHTPKRGKPPSSGFTTGGSKFDPLNSSI